MAVRRRDYNFEIESDEENEELDFEEEPIPAPNFELETKRRREKKTFDGHGFTFEKFNANYTISFWRCDKRFSEKCKVRIHIQRETGEVVKQINEHCHGADAAGIQVQKLQRNIRKRARETNEVQIFKKKLNFYF